MAIAFNATRKPKRGNLYYVDPRDVRINEPWNGRRWPHSPEDIRDRADNIKERGQLTPIKCRRDGMDLVLVSGHLRLLACLLIRETEPDWVVCCTVDANLNELDAFLANLTENEERKNTSVIDQSYNMARLEQSFGWSVDQVAAFYKCSPSRVRQIVSLKGLDEPIQRQVAAGEISLTDALRLLKLPADAQKAALEASEASDVPEADPTTPDASQGTPEARKERKRAVKEATTEAARAAGVRVGRTLRELKNVLKDFPGEISSTLLAYIAGECDETAVGAMLDRVNEAILEAVA